MATTMAAVTLKHAYPHGCRAQVLYHAADTLLRAGHEGVYAAVERPLQLAKTAAVLQILHGLVGLVRSPVSATLPQIRSRLFVTWGILWSFPETRTHMLDCNTAAGRANLVIGVAARAFVPGLFAVLGVAQIAFAQFIYV